MRAAHHDALTFETDILGEGMTFSDVFEKAKQKQSCLVAGMSDEDAFVALHQAYFSQSGCSAMHTTLKREFELFRTGEWPLSRLPISIYSWCLASLRDERWPEEAKAS